MAWTNLVGIPAKTLAHIGDFVHERDARGEHRICRVLAQLRADAIHHHDRRARPGERPVQVRHDRGGTLVVCANHHAVGLQEVFNGRALLQELGIADHAEWLLGLLANDLADPLRRSGRHRALVHDDFVAVERLADFFCHREHVTQVRGPVLARGRADGDEHHIGALDRLRQAGGEGQPLLGAVAAHELLEPGLINRDAAAVQGADLGGILVHANDGVARFREAGSNDEPDVSSSDDGDLHARSTP
jgi:hypothetical protein